MSNRAGLWTLLMLAICGCATPSYDPPQLVMPSQPPASIDKRTLAQSVNGRDIEMFVLPGDAQNAVLVIGGIHGNEPTSVDVAQGLLDLLQFDPALAKGRLVAIIPNANPDGALKKTRANARGVDLNRNFAATNFKPSRRTPAPLSEPESRALALAIESLKPTLLISIHSIDTGRHCNNYDGPASHIAAAMSRRNGYPAKDTIGYPTPGSLGTWAGKELQIPMITLELPRNVSGSEAWRDNRDALLAAIAL